MFESKCWFVISGTTVTPHQPSSLSGSARFDLKIRITTLPHQLTVRTSVVAAFFPSILRSSHVPPFHNCNTKTNSDYRNSLHKRLNSHLEDGACTDHPKSAIFNSPFDPSSKFSGLMSLWITFLEWQYERASASSVMYWVQKEQSLSHKDIVTWVYLAAAQPFWGIIIVLS